MSLVKEIQKDMAAVNEKITQERKKGVDKRDKRKVQKLQAEYAALRVELSRALAGEKTRKSASKAKEEEPEVEETEEDEDEDDDDD